MNEIEAETKGRVAQIRWRTRSPWIWAEALPDRPAVTRTSSRRPSAADISGDTRSPPREGDMNIRTVLEKMIARASDFTLKAGTPPWCA
jgi:hypothetical protein